MLGPPFLLIIFVSVLLCKRGATEKLGGMELRGVFISSVSINNSKLLM